MESKTSGFGRIIDNLETDSTFAPLSAKQGKVLKQKIDNLENIDFNQITLENSYAPDVLSLTYSNNDIPTTGSVFKSTAVVKTETKIRFYGGETTADVASNKVYEADLSSPTIVGAIFPPLPFAVKNHSYFVLGNKIYIVGGNTKHIMIINLNDPSDVQVFENVLSNENDFKNNIDFIFNDKLISFCGETSKLRIALKNVFTSWRTLDLNISKNMQEGSGFAVVNKKCYLLDYKQTLGDFIFSFLQKEPDIDDTSFTVNEAIQQTFSKRMNITYNRAVPVVIINNYVYWIYSPTQIARSTINKPTEIEILINTASADNFEGGKAVVHNSVLYIYGGNSKKIFFTRHKIPIQIMQTPSTNSYSPDIAISSDGVGQVSSFEKIGIEPWRTDLI